MILKRIARLFRTLAADRGAGFSLVEALMAICIMCFGLLSVGQLLLATIGGPVLARSKGSATLVAHDKLEFLAEAYRQNPDGPDLTLGDHGPEQVSVSNPSDGTVMNRFRVTWTVSDVPDPRAGKVLKAKRVRVMVVPITNADAVNNKASFNKVISMTNIFSMKPLG